jgi:protein translocase SecG subunit
MLLLLTILFVILVVVLVFFILIQQGKGDMGLGGAPSSGTNQMLFGGSGGQEFFEKMTWFLGALFIFGSLGLTVLKSKESRKTGLEGFKKEVTEKQETKKEQEKKEEKQEK